MKVKLYLAAAFLMLVLGSSVHACICPAVLPSAAFDRAEAVFTGKVVRSGKHEWTVKVNRVWKGDVAAEVTVFDAHPNSNCASRFKRGTEYLFLVDIDNSEETVRYSPQECNWGTRLRGPKIRVEDSPERLVEDFVLEGRGEGRPPRS